MGTTFRALDWKKRIFSWRAVPKTPNVSYSALKAADKTAWPNHLAQARHHDARLVAGQRRNDFPTQSLAIFLHTAIFPTQSLASA
jgi:hypothetical protein